jgi:hypothetical protein
MAGVAMRGAGASLSPSLLSPLLVQAIYGIRYINPTTPLSLALRFSAFTMREIGLVIAPLDPRHKSEALFNRICMQGQYDLE